MRTMTGMAAAFCMGLHLQAIADSDDYRDRCGVKTVTLHATSPAEYSGLWDLDVSGSAMCESGVVAVDVHRRSSKNKVSFVDSRTGDVSDGEFEISFSGVRAKYVAELLLTLAIRNPSPPTEDWCGFTKLGVGVYSFEESFPAILMDGVTSCGGHRPLVMLGYFPDSEEVDPVNHEEFAQSDWTGYFSAERYATSWYYGSVTAVYTDFAYQ